MHLGDTCSPLLERVLMSSLSVASHKIVACRGQDVILLPATTTLTAFRYTRPTVCCNRCPLAVPPSPSFWMVLRDPATPAHIPVPPTSLSHCFSEVLRSNLKVPHIECHLLVNVRTKGQSAGTNSYTPIWINIAASIYCLKSCTFIADR